MYELIKINENDYYVDCPTKIGIVKVRDNDVVLIDSGSDKDAGKKVLKILNENHWNLKAIFNTHSHADHIGGNAVIQANTNCPVYAKDMECVYTNNPELESIGLYGGYPFKDLNNKFLLAQKSSAQFLTSDVLPEGMTVLDLPGHSFSMTGFLTKNKTAYVADSIMSAEALKKYGITYQWNVNKVLESLDYLKSVKADFYVPSHSEAKACIAEEIEANKESILGIKEKITDLCNEPSTFETILKKLFGIYNIRMTSQQYVLVGSTVRSYISALYDEGKIANISIDGELLWSNNV